MSKEHEPPTPPQNRENPETPTPPQRRASENSSQKKRQGLMEYSENNEEKFLAQIAEIIIKGDRDDKFPYRIFLENFLNQHRIKNPFPLFEKLLERLTPEQALTLSSAIDGSQDHQYSSKLREKIKTGVNPAAILRNADFLHRYLSSEAATAIVQKAIFLLQTSDPNGHQIIFKNLPQLTNMIDPKDLETLAKDTMESMLNSGKPESILQNIEEDHFTISHDLDNLISKYTKKAVALLTGQGRQEEVFNYALNYSRSFQFGRMIKMRTIWGPIVIDVLKKPSEKIYKALLSAPDYYLDLSFMDRTEFENVLYETAINAAQDRDLMRLLFYQAGILRKFLGDKTENIWDECEKTDPELFRELNLR